MREFKSLVLPVIEVLRQSIIHDRKHEPDNMLDWLIKEQMEAGIEDDNDLVKKQLGATFASIHTTTQTMLHV
jgi:cytochrome P450